jgi:tryptophan synthase alpha chain
VTPPTKRKPTLRAVMYMLINLGLTEKPFLILIRHTILLVLSRLLQRALYLPHKTCYRLPSRLEKKITKVIHTKMKNRITDLFEKKKKNILNIFYTAGFPGLNDTKRIAESLEASGADMIEIGIPFSDPIADGPTIQESNKIALDQGMNLGLLIRQVKELRSTVTIPVVLMGYLNPVMQYGVEKFMRDAADAGVDGLILPDLPLHEYINDYKSLAESLNLRVSFLISPTTSESRIRQIDAVSSGFIYAVSSSSTTGAKKEFSEDQIRYFEKLQSLDLDNPFLIGFGISNYQTYSQACTYATGAIVGSSFITALKNSKDLPADIQSFVKSIKSR